MKKLIIASLLCILFLASASEAQTIQYAYQAVTRNITTAAPYCSTQTSCKIIGTGAAFHQLAWNVSGTLAACSVRVDSSADGITWGVGNVIAAQTCTSNGQILSASTIVNYVRVNVVTLTPVAGATLTVNLTGYQNNPTGGGGGSSAFSAITSGTNNSAAMVVDTGASIARTGSGTIDASSINNVNYPASPSTNTVPVVTGSNTITYEITPVLAGGTGTGTPNLVAGSNINISGTWPNQTITSTGTGFGGRLSFNATNYGVLANAQYAQTAAATVGSPVINCSTCTFVNSAAPTGDVGKIVWVMQSLTSGTLALAQTTILSVNSATQITANANATANTGGTGIIMWGSDDSTALDNAWTAATAVCGTVVLPAGLMLVQTPKFNTENTACRGILDLYNQSGVFGSGKQYTFLIPTPNFNFASCTPSCFFGPLYQIDKGLAVWGTNYSPAGCANKILAQNNGGFLEDVDLSGWCSAGTGTKGLNISGFGPGNYWGGVERFGNIGIYVTSTGSQFYNFVAIDQVIGMQVHGPSAISMGTYFQGSTSSVIVDAGFTWRSVGDFIQGAASNVVINGTAYIDGLQFVSTTTDPIYLNSGGTLVLHNSIMQSSNTRYSGAWLVAAAGSTYKDMGSNTVTGTATVPYATYTQKADHNQSSSTTNAVTITPAGANSLLLVGLEWVTTGQTVSGCADTQGNTYTQQGTTLTTTTTFGSARAFALLYTNGTASGAADTVTCTFSSSVSNSEMAVIEYTGQFRPGSPFENVYTNTGSGTAIAAGTTTTSTINSDIVGLFMTENTTATFTNTGVAQTVRVNGGATGYVFTDGLVIVPTTYTLTGNMSVNSDWAGYWFIIKNIAGPIETAGILSGGITTGPLSTRGLIISSKCAAVGSAASPSVVGCSNATAGVFSCATNASAATCTVNTGAVTANSEIIVQENSTEGTRLGVTCNTSPTSLPSITLASKTAGTGFTINVPTIVTNPACYNFLIIN